MDKNIDDKIINEALLGSPEASVKCTEAGVAIPCPFCGGEAEIDWGEDVDGDACVDIMCASCFCSTDGYYSYYDHPKWAETLALEYWNRRADLRGMGKEAPQQWIPVGERLPETNTWVFVSRKGFERSWMGRYSMSCSNGRHVWDIFHSLGIGGGYCDITHWMPLPQPPITGGDT